MEPGFARQNVAQSGMDIRVKVVYVLDQGIFHLFHRGVVDHLSHGVTGVEDGEKLRGKGDGAHVGFFQFQRFGYSLQFGVVLLLILWRHIRFLLFRWQQPWANCT